MEFIYLIIFVLFMIFIISLAFSLLKIFWPLLLIGAIYLGYKYHKQKKLLEEIGYTENQTSSFVNGDVIDADYEVKEEEETYED